MIIQQENRCAICGNEFIKAPCVDEDHNNQNRIRGLLCEKCNHGLGQFKDSIAYLQNAINYLSR
jgi:DNA-directed RNA polymerase subunit RPC12/RpoP